MRSWNWTISAALFGTLLTAQTTTVVAPKGYDTLPGSGGNAIPFWSQSATYMQVHDSADLQQVFPVPAVGIRAISWRKPNSTGSNTARSLDVQVTMGSTPVAPVNASTIFANNLGPAPTVVLPYTLINLPTISQVSNPNPQGWFLPFTMPFPYVISTGNLCYEVRFRNLSTTGGSLDAVSGANTVISPLFGNGCVASGQSLPATIGSRSLSLLTGSFVNRLDRAAASAPATFLLGTVRQQISIPGLCASLELLPALTLNGTTDTSGTWNVSFTAGQLYWQPTVTLYTQFVFADASLPLGLGLSDCSTMRIPPSVMSRIYAGPSGGGSGFELATSGAREVYAYGLVTGFDY